MDAGDEALIRSELQPGEILHWWGRPDPNRLFTGMDLLLVPFSLLWGGFALFWEATVIFAASRSASGTPVWFFILWGIPFVTVGLYLIAGRFILKRYLKSHTYYAVTDRRVLLISRAFRPTVRSASIKRLPGLEITTGSSGSGTITFGHWAGVGSMYANTGLEFFAWGASRPLAFYDVPDARGVYALVDRLAV